MVEDRPGKFRFTFDRRPANHDELHLPWLRLPMGAMLIRLALGDDQEARGSGSDVDSYFNRLRQHPGA